MFVNQFAKANWATTPNVYAEIGAFWPPRALRSADSSVDTRRFQRILVAMAVANATLDIPKNPAVRRAWIHMQLKLVGSSWTSLSAEIGVSRQAVQATAAGAPSLPIENALATKLGVTPQMLFPEHWTSAGTRIPQQRTELHRAKNSGSPAPRHVEKREVA